MVYKIAVFNEDISSPRNLLFQVQEKSVKTKRCRLNALLRALIGRLRVSRLALLLIIYSKPTEIHYVVYYYSTQVFVILNVFK